MKRPSARRTGVVVVACAAALATAIPSHAADAYSAFVFNLGTSEPTIYSFINSATSSLDMTMYELKDTTAVNDLIAREKAGVKVRVILDREETSTNAAENGVTVRVVLEDPSDYSSEVQQVEDAGATVVGYSSSTGFYIHAKAIVADYGLPTQEVEAGSMNITSNSLGSNRELGIILNDSGVASVVENAFDSDYAGGAPA